jgi:hypothetical protein
LLPAGQFADPARKGDKAMRTIVMLTRTLKVICLVGLLSGCSLGADDAQTIIDVAQKAGPFITAISETLEPTPTFGLSQPINDYFDFAATANCESIIARVDYRDPVQSIVCHDDVNGDDAYDVTVRYDNWWSVDTMEKHRVCGTKTWSDTNNPEVPLGKLCQFIDSEGRANIMWTVTRPPGLSHLSGWAWRADDNQDALYDWWAETGADHN